VTDRLKFLLDIDVSDDDLGEASHDFDQIRQENCRYEKEKTFTIDVEKIIGIGGKATSQDREAVETLASEFEFKPVKQIEEEAAALV